METEGLHYFGSSLHAIVAGIDEYSSDDSFDGFGYHL
jgi:hypothetical protein